MDETIFQSILRALAFAPFDPAGWADALNGLARLCGAASAQFISFGHRQSPVLIAPGFSEDDIARYAALRGPDPAVNRGVAQILKSRQWQISSDVEYMTEAERRTDMLYNEFFRPCAGEHASFGILARNSDLVSVINLFHDLRHGPLNEAGRNWLARVLPYIERSVQLQSKIEDRAAQVALGAFDGLKAAVVICDFDGCIVEATRAAESMLSRGDILTVQAGRLRPHDRTLEPALYGSIRAAARVRPQPQSSTMVLRSLSGAAARLDINPLPMNKSPTSVRMLALVYIHHSARNDRLDLDLVCAAFGLTRVQAEVADGLLRGMSSAQIAAWRGVSIETIHTHVKSILAKTNCSRRAELPNLLQPFRKF